MCLLKKSPGNPGNWSKILYFVYQHLHSSAGVGRCPDLNLMLVGVFRVIDTAIMLPRSGNVYQCSQVFATHRFG